MRFVVCGEALIDLVPGEGEGTTFASDWRALSAGGPMNTAVGLARLGERVEFAGRLSTDWFGHQLRDHLRANGVGLDRAVVEDAPTSLAVVSLDADLKASYAFHFAGTANFGWTSTTLPDVGGGDWLHVASLVTVVQPAASVLREWVAAGTGPVSLDVNVRPSVVPDPADYWALMWPWLEAVGARGGVLKASEDDVAFLARGAGVAGDPVEVFAGWAAQAGASLAVVTLGPDGAAAVDAGGHEVRRPGRRVDVVDTVGAGDTFMAGFLSAYVGSGDVDAALDRGIAASALVCTRRGPQPPTRAEVEAYAAS